MRSFVITDTTDLISVASTITYDSEMFADEVQTVGGLLREALREANHWGCAMEITIPDMWGGVVKVTAIPTKGNRKHSWAF